jgi:glycosyltransferase involved in cell wall biosynthesis
VLASRVGEDGDRDGLPNVLVEAQSQGLAVVSTRVSAIPELVEDGVTGLLAEPGDRAGLSNALLGLIGDPERRARFGQAGERRVRTHFDMDAGMRLLAGRFAGSTDASAAEATPHRRAAG